MPLSGSASGISAVHFDSVLQPFKLMSHDDVHACTLGKAMAS